MPMGMTLLLILLVFLVGTIPSRRPAKGWGAAVLGFFVVVLAELIFIGIIPWFGWVIAWPRAFTAG
jgi:hypothetical protein